MNADTDKSKQDRADMLISMFLDFIIDELDGKNRKRAVVGLLVIIAVFAAVAYLFPLFAIVLTLLGVIIVICIATKLYTNGIISQSMLALFIVGVAPRAAAFISKRLLILIDSIGFNNQFNRLRGFLGMILLINRFTEGARTDKYI